MSAEGRQDRSEQTSFAAGPASTPFDPASTPFDAEAGLQAIIDNSAAVIFIKDREGRYTMANDAFMAPLPFSRDQVIGRTPAELWPGMALSPEGDLRVLREGVVDTRDEVVELRDGVHIIMTVRFPLRGADGRIDSVAGIATDVTERKAAEEALKERDQLLETILRASPDIVTVIDERARVKAISDASATVLGYDLSDPVHEEVEALVHPDDIPLVYRAYSGLLDRRDPSLDVRYRVRHSDGRWLTFETRGHVMVGEEGAVTGAVVVSRDVTEDLEFEQELHDALLAAEQASAAKSLFLSRMSHELRTPLNSILGFAQLLEMEQLPPERAEAVGHILQGGNHLLGLIDEVLDIARIESGRLDLSLHPVELGELVSEAVDLSRPMAERCSVSISIDARALEAGLCVLADRQRLLQVLLNLLSNAVKYNVAGGTVNVSVDPAWADGRVLISVSDSGPGIASESIERVFEPFERLGAERGSVEGTGVGLTLSQHLVREMGGEISVTSELDVGTTFTVSLSARPSSSAAEPAPASRTFDAGGLRAMPDVRAMGDVRGLRGLKVLHVEDDLANLELVERVLERAGRVQLLSATRGSEALALVRTHRPDLVLLDLHLPDMSGTDVIARLRSDPGTAQIPVVVVSADAPAVLQQPVPEGVVACLAKPVDLRDLLSVVESVLPGSGTAL